ncbi:MAG: GspMb/PilO family protein [Gemmatimonadales bacterium]
MTQRERRIVLWGAAIASVAIVGKLVLAGGLGIGGARRAHLLAREHLLDAERSIALLPVLEDSAASLRSRLEGLSASLLAATSRGEALADLSGRMRTLVGHAGGEFVGSTPMPDSNRAGNLHRVSLRASLLADVSGLRTLLRLVAQSRVLIGLEAARVHSQNPFAGDDAPERLEVDLVVSGWFIAP